MHSLKKDVEYCILDNENKKNWPAPFPALLYCFSTIDLMGALYWKCTSKDSKQKKNCEDKYKMGVTNKSLNYMIDFMSYSELEATLIQKVFRHNLVHLAQPSPKVKYKETEYSWHYYHKDPNMHLQIKKDLEKNIMVFYISILNLVEDVVNSVLGPNGYLERLSENTEDGIALRIKFDKMYVEIYQPND